MANIAVDNIAMTTKVASADSGLTIPSMTSAEQIAAQIADTINTSRD